MKAVKNDEQNKRDLDAAMEATRNKLRKINDKLPITMYDCFILVLILATLIRPELFNWWFASLFALCWERPRILFRMSVRRIRLDLELRRSEKQMLQEINDANIGENE